MLQTQPWKAQAPAPAPSLVDSSEDPGPALPVGSPFSALGLADQTQPHGGREDTRRLANGTIALGRPRVACPGHVFLIGKCNLFFFFYKFLILGSSFWIKLSIKMTGKDLICPALCLQDGVPAWGRLGAELRLQTFVPSY